MDGRLHNLNCRIIARIDGCIRRKWHLGEAEGARVGVLRGADYLEDGDHGEGHVLWSVIGAISAEPKVHVEEGRSMALEPAWLDCDCTSEDGPFCPVGGGGHTAAWQGDALAGAREIWKINNVLRNEKMQV
jgi:hypothetical protein